MHESKTLFLTEQRSSGNIAFPAYYTPKNARLYQAFLVLTHARTDKTSAHIIGTNVLSNWQWQTIHHFEEVTLSNSLSSLSSHEQNQ